MKLFKLFIINLLTKGLSENFEHEGRDEHGCIITKGYSWCNDLQSCIRMWETPCYDYFEDCENERNIKFCFEYIENELNLKKLF